MPFRLPFPRPPLRPLVITPSPVTAAERLEMAEWLEFYEEAPVANSVKGSHLRHRLDVARQQARQHLKIGARP